MPCCGQASWECGPTTAPLATKTPCAACNSCSRKCCRLSVTSAKSLTYRGRLSKRRKESLFSPSPAYAGEGRGEGRHGRAPSGGPLTLSLSHVVGEGTCA